VGELRYYAYGETRYTSGSTPTSYRFTGQREDATIGLYFYNARYYDASLGRFVQADSIVPNPGNPQSLNRYSYVVGNPLKYTDPSGHEFWMGEGGGGGETEDELDFWIDPSNGDDNTGDGIIPPWEVEKFDALGFRVSGGGGYMIVGVELKLELIQDPQNRDDGGLFFGIDIQFGPQEGGAIGGGIVEAGDLESYDDYGGWDWSIAGEAATSVGGLEVDFEQSLDSPAYNWYISPVADFGAEVKLATGPGFSFELARFENGKWSPPAWFQRLMEEK
jgi:RHS repeat-associated protein